ncbi:hypothetical protein PAMP_010750 [Pampus punctatissimus]
MPGRRNFRVVSTTSGTTGAVLCTSSKSSAGFAFSAEFGQSQMPLKHFSSLLCRDRRKNCTDSSAFGRMIDTNI